MEDDGLGAAKIPPRRLIKVLGYHMATNLYSPGGVSIPLDMPICQTIAYGGCRLYVFVLQEGL